MERKKFVVKRSEWLRGGRDGMGGAAASRLIDVLGHKCCLGFAGVQLCNLRPGQMVGCGTPRSADHLISAYRDGMPGLMVESTLSEIMRVNDVNFETNVLARKSQELENEPPEAWEAWREAKLKELFNEIEIDVEFID